MCALSAQSSCGNNPNLPADTVSRQIRILLMPDLNGVIEDSDWEVIEPDAKELKNRIRGWADTVREGINADVPLPKGCIGRRKEKWRPLARVAAAAGGRWPATIYRLIELSIAEEDAEREAGLKQLPAGMVMMVDLYAIWPKGETFASTLGLIDKLVLHHPEYWGPASPYGKALTEHRLGKIVSQAAKVTSCRPGGRGPRGYLRAQLAPVWRRLGIGPKETGATGDTGATGADDATCAGISACTGYSGTPVTDPSSHPAETPDGMTDRVKQALANARRSSVGTWRPDPQNGSCDFCGDFISEHMELHRTRGHCSKPECMTAANQEGRRLS